MGNREDEFKDALIALYSVVDDWRYEIDYSRGGYTEEKSGGELIRMSTNDAYFSICGMLLHFEYSDMIQDIKKKFRDGLFSPDIHQFLKTKNHLLKRKRDHLLERRPDLQYEIIEDVDTYIETDDETGEFKAMPIGFVRYEPECHYKILEAYEDTLDLLTSLIDFSPEQIFNHTYDLDGFYIKRLFKSLIVNGFVKGNTDFRAFEYAFSGKPIDKPPVISIDYGRKIHETNKLAMIHLLEELRSRFELIMIPSSNTDKARLFSKIFRDIQDNPFSEGACIQSFHQYSALKVEEKMAKSWYADVHNVLMDLIPIKGTP